MATVSIDWGDGSELYEQEVDAEPAQGASWSLGASHGYAEPGTYTVTVTGIAGGEGSTEVEVPPPPPQVTVTVPAAMSPQQGVAYEYETSLTNTGGEVPSAQQVVRLWRADGANLMPNQVVYETYDTGQWVTKTLVRDGAALVLIEAYPIPADLDATSQVRVTFTTAVDTVIKGRSTVRDGSTVLAQADYTYTVQAASAPVTVTAFTPNPLSVQWTPTTATGTGLGSGYTVMAVADPQQATQAAPRVDVIDDGGGDATHVSGLAAFILGGNPSYPVTLGYYVVLDGVGEVGRGTLPAPLVVNAP